VPPEEYAQVLLEMAGSVASHGGRLAWQPQAIIGCSNLSERIDRVLAGQRRDASHLSLTGWAAVALCGIPLFCVAAALQLDRPEPGAVAGQGLTASREMDLLIKGWNLKPVDVQRLEKQVQRNPEDLEARALLLSHYFQNAIRYPRVEHIFWLIEHHPDSWVLDTRGAGFVLVAGNPLNTEADYEKARNLWLRQIERYPDNERVVRRAVGFVMLSDRSLAEQLIQGKRESSPQQHGWTARLAGLYAHAIDARETTPPEDVRRNSWAEPTFAAHARDVLETSDNPMLVGFAGEWFAGYVDQLRSDPELTAQLADSIRRRGDLAEKFLRRAHKLDPDNPRWRERLEQLERSQRQ
jgi:tetratricopeptide (TPR) repeat protein